MLFEEILGKMFLMNSGELAMEYNKVLISGNLTEDVKLSYLPNQTSVATFDVAANRTWRNKDGEKQQEVCFIQCVAFGKLGDNINQYFGKGKPIFLEGTLKQDTWKDKDTGQKKSKHKVLVQSFQFIPTGEKRQTETEDSEIPF